MSYTNGKRSRQRTTHTKFQTGLGMRLIRHDMDIYNSALKRGLIERTDEIVREHFVICGCGAEGCGFISVIRRGDEGSMERLRAGLDPWRRERTAA